MPISATRSRPREAARTWSRRPTSGRHERSKPRRSVSASAFSTSGGTTFLDYCGAPAPSALEPRPRRRGLARRLRGAVRGRRALARRAVDRAGGRRPLPGRPRRRRHAEHVLLARLRALRRRPLGDGRARRLAPRLRVRLPQPRLAHADRADARHAPGAPDLPPHAADRRRGAASGAVHARHRRGRRGGALADQPARRRRARARSRLRRGAPALLHADARAGRQVQPDDLAVPRDAGRDRLRARLRARGGALLPLGRPQRAARLPAEGRQRR